MNAEFYTISDDPRKLSKSLGNPTTKACKVYDSCSVLAPTLLLRYDSNIAKCNYLHIAEWNRYYFIDNVTVDNAKTMTVQCSIDVLMSYKNQILACNATCIRNETIGTNETPDTEFPIMPASNHVTSLDIGEYFDLNAETAKGSKHYLLSTK